jgi:uncharacterized protein (TIGR00290 family)
MAIGKNRALVSWSGGKDCCLAWARSRQSVEVVGLVTVMTEDGRRSRSHGLPREVLQWQAATMELPLFTTNATWDSYGSQFSELIRRVSGELGATQVIFGDIFPTAHREWAERICRACQLTALEPLWAEPTASLVREFLSQGGEAFITTVRDEKLDSSWLGRFLDVQAIGELISLGVDPCGERGEYHSFVTYFPGFRHRVNPRHLGVAQHDDCSLLELAVAPTSVGVH